MLPKMFLPHKLIVKNLECREKCDLSNMGTKGANAVLEVVSILNPIDFNIASLFLIWRSWTFYSVWSPFKIRIVTSTILFSWSSSVSVFFFWHQRCRNWSKIVKNLQKSSKIFSRKYVLASIHNCFWLLVEIVRNIWEFHLELFWYSYQVIVKFKFKSY